MSLFLAPDYDKLRSRNRPDNTSQDTSFDGLYQQSPAYEAAATQRLGQHADVPSLVPPQAQYSDFGVAGGNPVLLPSPALSGDAPFLQTQTAPMTWSSEPGPHGPVYDYSVRVPNQYPSEISGPPSLLPPNTTTTWRPLILHSAPSTDWGSHLRASLYDLSCSVSETSSLDAQDMARAQMAHSPMVKTEVSEEHGIRPEDVFTEPLEQSISAPPEHANLSPSVSPSPKAGRSAQARRRPDLTRRPYSSNDLQGIEMLEDRPKRTYTRPEDAVCACEVCGRLFQRVYNLKAHMETHDPFRSHPHVCMWPECEKRFSRRTDLLRHERSVHFKSRDHECPLCRNSFARKDTMLRHIEDGCSRRPQVKRSAVRSRKSADGLPRQNAQEPTPSPPRRASRR